MDGRPETNLPEIDGNYLKKMLVLSVFDLSWNFTKKIG
jgi:hypothetical protein